LFFLLQSSFIIGSFSDSLRSISKFIRSSFCDGLFTIHNTDVLRDQCLDCVRWFIRVRRWIVIIQPLNIEFLELFLDVRIVDVAGIVCLAGGCDLWVVIGIRSHIRIRCVVSWSVVVVGWVRRSLIRCWLILVSGLSVCRLVACRLSVRRLVGCLRVWWLGIIRSFQGVLRSIIEDSASFVLLMSCTGNSDFLKVTGEEIISVSSVGYAIIDDQRNNDISPSWIAKIAILTDFAIPITVSLESTTHRRSIWTSVTA